MIEQQDELSRRFFLRAAGVTGIGGIGAGAGLFLASEPAAAVVRAIGMTQEDLTVEGSDQRLDRLTIAPKATVTWSNFDEAVHGITLETSFTVDGKVHDDWGAVGRPWSESYTVDSPGTDGHHSVDEDRRVIVFTGPDPQPHSEASPASVERTYQIGINYAVTVTGSDGQPASPAELATDEGATTFQVAVDAQGSVSVRGKWRAEARA